MSLFWSSALSTFLGLSFYVFFLTRKESRSTQALLKQMKYDHNAEYLGKLIIRAVSMLKLDGRIGSRCPVEAYLADDKYDLMIMVSLREKKSQYEIGMEMFHGVKK